jgi:hypothetical protein
MDLEAPDFEKREEMVSNDFCVSLSDCFILSFLASHFLLSSVSIPLLFTHVWLDY